MPAKILQEFDNYVKSLSSKDRVGILTDNDTDGITAGVLVFKALYQITGKFPELVLFAPKRSAPISEETVKELKKKKINKFICTDISLDQESRLLFAKKIAKFAKILNIDHHKVYGKLPKGSVLVKPQFFSKKESSSYCSAKLCFDLFSRHASLKGSEWIAIVGLFGDKAEKDWPDFLEAHLNHNPSKAKLEQLNETLTAVRILDFPRIPDCFNNLLSTEPKTALNAFFKYNKKYEKILDKGEKAFWKNAECFPGLEYCFYFSEENHTSASALINRISDKAKNTTLIIAQNADNGISFSSRRQDRKVAVNDLLEEAVKNLNGGTAGGHAPAAGGKIRAQDLQKFRQNVLEILERKYAAARKKKY
ncbi:MAG: DHHA1 domain-containing protein [Candidatus Diapherotrites archaeon]|nr:DHHA1 domain-containing protein [Candidatus Diapherotrites archaeon]